MRNQPPLVPNLPNSRFGHVQRDRDGRRQLSSFLVALDRLYAAALDPAEWRTFLVATAALFDANNAYVSQIANDRRVLNCVALKQMNLQPGCEKARSQDPRYTLFVSVHEHEDTTNYLGVTRDPSDEPFTAVDRETILELVPHIERAFLIRRRLAQQRGLCDLQPSAIASDRVTTAAIGIFSNPARTNQTVSAESIVQSRFGLSPRQAVLTTLLLSGRSVKEAAAALGLTEGTARQYLKLIFSKTGARRQVDLVRIVAKALAPQI